jgi:hypothetical protein
VVPKNMEGAGSLRLANWLYNVAAKDGTVMGTIGRGTGEFLIHSHTGYATPLDTEHPVSSSYTRTPLRDPAPFSDSAFFLRKHTCLRPVLGQPHSLGPGHVETDRHRKRSSA